MELVLNLLFLAGGIAALYYGADYLVKGGVDIAGRLGISPLVIGLTLVAFATSAPELAVSVSAALEGNPDIALGNVVGSNIANIGLILGVCACILPLNVNAQLLKNDVPVMIAAAVGAAGFYFFCGGINRIAALVFFVAFLIYTVWSIFNSRNNPEKEEKTSSKYPLYLAIIIVIASFGVLVGGAKIFLKGAVFFAKILNMSDAVIGLTVAAVGTSLPEFATSVVASFKGEKDIAIGNVVGSNILNIFCILGLTGIVKPIENASVSIVDFAVMIIFTVLLSVMMFTGRRLNRIEGAVLTAFYIGYTVYLCL